MTRERFNRMNKAFVHWEELSGEIERITNEHEKAGWDTLVLHPGDVSTTTEEARDQKAGFHLVVLESELDALEQMVDEDEDSYDEFEVHRAPTGDLLLFLVIVKSTEYEKSLFFPVYYDPKIDREFTAAVSDKDTIYTDVTNLDQTRRFSFSNDKPNLFSP